MSGWQPIETAPRIGFFMIWSPDHPEIPMVVKGEIFYTGLRKGTSGHLSFNHFTHWQPLPDPPEGK